ncbi:MAG: UvrD-helicase domain-containing protein [Planctomycetales bacterium]|nr:UvrD-helicase domain-containing protein [Planctomycetales bacterium]
MTIASTEGGVTAGISKDKQRGDRSQRTASAQLADLNPAQREAVQTVSGPLLILAGAGTGKTRVITYRMAELIRRRVPPGRILSVTFTNKAAREMQERTTALLGRAVKPGPLVCTFHAFCVRVLRQEITALGYPRDFTIYDRGDQESAARSALRDIRVPETSLRPGDLLAIISRWKMLGVLPPQATEAAETDRELLAASAYRRYQTTLKTSAAVDFDDLLLLTHQLFEDHPDVLDRNQQRFDHVQIDEYQDTNGMQFAIVEALVRPHKNICVVGDDDQSIYGWRGAEVKHILGFPKTFPGTKVIRLEDNYRCTDQILQVANELVRHNRDRHEKRLISHKPSHDEVRFVDFADENLEAERIVREIQYFIQTSRAAASDFAILFRTNEQPRPFEMEMRKRQVPYVILGSQSFFDRREIKDVLSYLKAVMQPTDEISMLRIINVPTRGIGSSTVEKLLARAVSAGQRIWEIMPAALAAGDVPKSAATAIAGFRELLERYRTKFVEHPKHLSETVRSLIQEINYDAEIERQYKEPLQQQARTAMLEEFVETVRNYESHAAKPSLTEFLEQTALVGRDEPTDKEELLSQNGVKLMTLHSAKGLEFPRVYVVGMEEGLLPHQRSIDSADASVDEERRLAYVGVTRARDFLTLSRATERMKWGKRRPSVPSRFLFEMRGMQPLPTSDEADDLDEDEPDAH